MTQDQAPRKVYIKTYGCQMNAYDSERMVEILRPLGFATSDCAEDADLIILNTCHIREKASDKVYSELGRLRVLQTQKAQQGGRMMLAVAGCVAQAEGEEILARAPQVDMVFGPQTYHRLPEMLSRAERQNSARPERILETDFPIEDKFDHLPEERDVDGVTSFLTIQEGCDKFCTFCVVPYTRGGEQSRPVAAILEEARRLTSRGAREITLLGQNVNAYHGEGPNGRDWNLASLIRALGDIEGIARIRYTTSHPRDMDEDLIRAHGEVEALMPFLHLPVQSGSDRILASMNRRHTGDDFRRIVDKLRDVRPDIALGSDFIVGFPGESDQEFAETLKLVTDIGFASHFSFKYSPRPGTPAADMVDTIAETVKAERLASLQQLLDAQQDSFNRSWVGKELPVLIEKTGRHEGQLVGRSPYLQPVHLDSNSARIGDIVTCVIEDLKSYSLFGHMVEISPAQGLGQSGGFEERVCA